MSKSKAPTMQPVTTQMPSAGESYGSFLQSYAGLQGTRRQVELSDAATASAVARQQAPEELALMRQYGPEYNRIMQQIEAEAIPGQVALTTAQAPLQAAQAGLTRQAREAELKDVAELTPVLRRALGGESGARMHDELSRQLESELAMGAQLDPSLRREIEQSVRAAQTARGMSRGTGAVAAEATIKGTRAEELRRARQQAAYQFLNSSNTFGAAPYQAITQTGYGQERGGPWSAGGTGGGAAAGPAGGFGGSSPTSGGFSQMVGGAMAQNQAAAQYNIENAWRVQQAKYANSMFDYQSKVNRYNQVNKAFDPGGVFGGMYPSSFYGY